MSNGEPDDPYFAVNGKLLGNENSFIKYLQRSKKEKFWLLEIFTYKM